MGVAWGAYAKSKLVFQKRKQHIAKRVWRQTTLNSASRIP